MRTKARKLERKNRAAELEMEIMRGYVTFQLAEVAVSRQMFQEILMLIARLRVPPAPA